MLMEMLMKTGKAWSKAFNDLRHEKCSLLDVEHFSIVDW